MKAAYDRGWISTRDGNCSFKEKDSDEILITPSGVDKSVLKDDDILSLKIFEDKLILENSTPSGELDMHWRLLRSEDSDACVLHLHPTNIVAAMLAGFRLKDIAEKFPEVFRFSSIGDDVPAVPATSSQLAAHTYSAIHAGPPPRASIVGQKFHGVCAIGKDPQEAFEHIERLEHVCQITLTSRVAPNSL